MSSYKYPTKFRNTEAIIQTVNPRNLIVGQYYLIQHIKEGLPSIFLDLYDLSAKQKKAILEKVITRFRGRFVEYITGNTPNLESENPTIMMPIGMGNENERVAVFEDVDIISSNDKNIFSDGIYVIKNTETPTPTKKVIGTAYRGQPDKTVKDTQFKELFKGRKYYTGFDTSKWAFAPTLSREFESQTFNQLVNQSQDPNLSDKQNQLIDFRRDVVAIEGITNLISEYLGTDVPEIVPRALLNTNQGAIINSRFNEERMANARNVNQQNATKKRNTATAELAAREFTDVDGGSRRRKTRRSKMRKNKTRSKRRKHTKRHRK